jgi:hypothetical protein
VISANLTVSVDCELKSTITNQTLWQYNGTVFIDLSGGSGGGGLAGLIIKAVVTSMNAALADYVPYAKQANYIAVSSMPYGKYHILHNKDQQQEFVDQTP